MLFIIFLIHLKVQCFQSCYDNFIAVSWPGFIYSGWLWACGCDTGEVGQPLVYAPWASEAGQCVGSWRWDQTCEIPGEADGSAIGGVFILLWHCWGHKMPSGTGGASFPPRTGKSLAILCSIWLCTVLEMLWWKSTFYYFIFSQKHKLHILQCCRMMRQFHRSLAEITKFLVAGVWSHCDGYRKNGHAYIFNDVWVAGFHAPRHHHYTHSDEGWVLEGKYWWWLIGISK